MLDQFKAKLERTKVTIREVGLREGLQSHNMVLSTDTKVDLFRRLVEAHVKDINAVAFVNARRMPQMGDAEELLRSLGGLRDGIDISGVVLSDRGLERAIRMKKEGVLDTIFLVFSPVEESMMSNGITSNSEALLAQIERAAARAAAENLKVAVFSSESFGSPNSGWIDPKRVIGYVARIATMPGVREIVISDSTGQADPLQVMSFFTELAAILPTGDRITFHVHDSRGAGLANIVAALCSPFTNFALDTSFGGLGGDFPFIADAFGNVATEDLCEMLTGMGFDHGVDVDEIVAVSKHYAQISGRPLTSKLSGCSTSLKWKRDRLHPLPAR
jgi:hydroxymethylglutaryl-CoA lyase